MIILQNVKILRGLRACRRALVIKYTQMRDIIYAFIMWIARVHDHILSINDNGDYNLDDKQLHFLVVGAFGMLLIFLIQPIFKGLAELDRTLVITWIYVFTVVLVLTFAIEIGQWYSGTGVMDSSDIAYGITGFLVMFFIYAVIRGLILTIRSMLKDDDRQSDRDRY